MAITIKECEVCGKTFIANAVTDSHVCINCYNLASLCFGIVVEIRRHNDAEMLVDEKFESISDNRKQYLYDNIKAVIANPTITAKDMHDEWMRVRVEDGWTYSKTTDRNNKKHDCLVEYEVLDFKQKLKDHLVVETIKMYFNLK
jgi:hypothetical protein